MPHRSSVHDHFWQYGLVHVCSLDSDLAIDRNIRNDQNETSYENPHLGINSNIGYSNFELGFLEMIKKHIA